MSQTYLYPETHKSDHVDTFHGVDVPDPYHWLEDPDSPQTTAWVDNQIALTEQFLSGCPLRDKIRNRITQLFDYPKYGCPWREGNNYFFFKNDGLQNHHVLYVQDHLHGEPKVFFDPNKLSEEGDVSLRTYSFSESGDFFAYGLSQKGSDWVTILIKTVSDKHPLSAQLTEKLEWVKFSGISWTHDDRGFFYSRYPKPESSETTGKNTKSLQNHQVYYHFLGTPQEQDFLVYAEPDQPAWNFGAEVTDDGKFVCITVSKDCDPVNKFFYYELPKDWNPEKIGIFPVTKLVDNFDAEYSYITNEGPLFYFKTNLNAPRYKLIAIDLTRPSEVKEILTQTDDVLSYIVPINHNKFLVVYIRHVVDYLELYDFSGKLIYIFPLPTLGTILSVKGRKKNSEIFYQFGSFLSPGTIFYYTFDPTVEIPLTVFRDTEIVGFNASLFETEQIFYPSKDGTKIPMFIVRKKTAQKNGKNPVYMYGYGGFSNSLQPYFSVSRLVWMQHLGGIFVTPNLRGGGEYGEEWHQAGVKERKQNVFDDFHAAAEYLIKENWTRAELITISGGSNGGLLVGACANQRPELYGCAIAAVGVLDMLRYHKFTIGHFWVSDYGCSDFEKDFKYLYAYSPIHNVPNKPYPSLLLTTADHDDRVPPLHSYKLIATLQEKLGKNPIQKNPLLIRIDKKAGHGDGKPTTKVIAETADTYAFASRQLGLEWED